MQSGKAKQDYRINSGIFMAIAILSLSLQLLPSKSQVTLQPFSNVVQAVSNLTIGIILPQATTTNSFMSGDNITISLVPDGGSFLPATATSPPINCSSITSGIKVVNCMPSMQGQTLSIVINVTGGVSLTAVKIVVSSFVNPYSTHLFPVNVSMTNAGAPRPISNQASIPGLIPVQMWSSYIGSKSNLVADNTTLVFDFSTRNPLRPASQLWVQIPLWNPSDPNPTQSLLPNLQCWDCGFVQDFNCSYNASNQRLLISNPYQTFTTANCFYVSGYTNPYNDNYKSGYQIVVTDGTQDGIVETSGPLTFGTTPTQGINLPNATIVSVNPQSTVSQLTSLVLTVFVPIPIDANCRIDVVFPSDMPLMSQDFILQNATGPQFQGQNTTATMPTFFKQNGFSVHACPNYIQANSTFQIQFQARNKAFWESTQNFTVSVSSVDEFSGLYPFASTNSLFLDTTQFLPGRIGSFSIQPTDSNATGATTKIMFSIGDLDPLPLNSILTIQFPPSITLQSDPCLLLKSPFQQGNCIATSNNTLTISNAFNTKSNTSLIYIPAGQQLTFVTSAVVANPSVQVDAGVFLVGTSTIDNGIANWIDMGTFDNVYLPSNSLNSQQTTASSGQVYCLSPLNLFNGSCYSQCPFKLCQANGQCRPCIPQINTQIVQYAFNTVPQSIQSISTLYLNLSLNTSNTVPFQNNDTIIVTIPWSFGGQYSNKSNLPCTLNNTGIALTNCILVNNSVQFNINVSKQAAGQSLNISFQLPNFTNPSTALVQSIHILVIDQVGNIKAVLNNTTYSAVPNTIILASLQSSSQTVGDSNQILNVTFVTASAFPTGYQVQMLFPFWNPNQANPQHMIQSSKPICTSSLNTKVSCFYDPTRRTLVLSNVASRNLTPSSTISFTVSSFINPYNAIPKNGFQIATVQNDTNGFGPIDQTDSTSLTVTAPLPASLPSFVYRADNVTTVGEYSYLSFGIRVPLPIDSGCVIQIILPPGMLFSPEQFEGYDVKNGTGIFSNSIYFTWGSTADTLQETISIIGCQYNLDTAAANQTSYMTLFRVRNPQWVQSSQPFIIQLFANYGPNQFPIAQTPNNTNTTIISTQMLSTGNITEFSIQSADNQGVGQQATYAISFTPSHYIPYRKNQIVIKFPKALQLNPANSSNCSITNQNMMMWPSCYVDSTQNALVFNDIDTIDEFLLPSGGQYYFTLLSGGINPIGACDPGDYQITTYAALQPYNGGQNANRSLYPIDTYTMDQNKDVQTGVFTPFIPIPNTLNATILNPSNLVASTLANYSFVIYPQSKIAVNSTVLITVPYQNYAPFTLAFIQNIHCTSSASTAKIQVLQQIQWNSIMLTGVFGNSAYTSSAAVYINCTNIINPRMMGPIQNFNISIGDISGCPNAITSASFLNNVSITSLPQFLNVTIASEQPYNGAVAPLDIIVVPGFPLYMHDIITFQFPPQLNITTSNIVSTISPNDAWTISTVLPNLIQVVLQPWDYASQKFVYKISNVQNAPNSIPLPMQGIYATDMNGNPIMSMSYMVNIQNQPAPTNATLLQTDARSSMTTDYSLIYNTSNPMPSGAAFQIQYSSAVVIPTANFTFCYIQANNKTYNMTCKNDNANYILRLTNGLTDPIPQNAQIKIRVGPVTNPQQSLSTKSITVVSFTDSSFNYSIDKINIIAQTSNITASCSSPCSTCPNAQNASYCLSCQNGFWGTVNYALNGACLSTCPSGYYADSSNTCRPCMPNCLTCTNNSTCSQCNSSPTSLYSYMNMSNSNCVSQCSPGTYANSVGQCTSCSSNCQSCVGSSTNCTACNQQSNFTFIQRGQCVSQCANGTTNVNGVCTNCSAPCATCSGTVTSCISCSSGMLLGQTCTTTCSAGFYYNSVNRSCADCGCNGKNATFAPACGPGMAYFNGSCFNSCPLPGQQPTSGATPTCFTLNNGTTRTLMLLNEETLSISAEEGTLTVFLSAVAFCTSFKLISSLFCCIAFFMVGSNDKAFIQGANTHTCKVLTFILTSFLLSVNLYKLIAGKCLRNGQMKIQYSNAQIMHSYFTFLVSLNIVAFSTVTASVDAFLLINYSWSTGYYFSLVTVLAFTVTCIVAVVFEQILSKKTRTFDTTEPSTHTIPKMEDESAVKQLHCLDESADAGEPSIRSTRRHIHE